MAAGVTRKDDSPAHQSAGTAGPAAAAPPGRRQRGAGWRAQTTLALAVCLAGAGWAPRGAHAQKGYDKEERETGIWTGYCLPLDFNQPVGLCEQFKGSPRVCAASIDGMNTKSAFYWLDNEIFNIRAPHTDKTLTQGSQSFETLQLYMVNWACKQIGENVRQRSTLSPAEKQQAACNFVWRRDQEIQNESLFSVPAPGYPWGTFMYKPPGKNLTTFMFKGVPKKQCTHDYDCRGQNTPGDVYTCCDYCEDYFNRYCEVDPDVVFKFCMEKVQCVCNSVQKTCSKPRTDRCPKNEKGEPLCHPAFNDGMYFPVHGAPCSSAAKLGALQLAIPTLLLLSMSAALFP